MQKVNLTPNSKRASFDGITFTGEVDANGNRLTTLNGSRSLLSGSWKQRGPNLWVYGGRTQQGSTSYKECSPGFNGRQYPEDVYKNNYPLRHDTLLSTLKTGGFYFDYNTEYDNPTNQKMEIGVATYAFDGEGGLIENNEVAHNMIPEIGFDYLNEGGGGKFVASNLILRNIQRS